MAPTVSVVTATAGGRLELLRRKLDALAGQSLAPTSIEWVVCDDGGREPRLRELLAERPPLEVKLTALDRPGGPGAARNAALALAEGEVVYLSDDDCVPAPHTIEAHLKAQEAAGRPGAATVGGLLFEPPGGRAKAARPSRVGWWQVNGANTAVPAAALREVGGFDASLEGYGVEDVLLGYRLTELGLRFVALPDALAVHVGPDPMDGHDLDKPESAGRNAARAARLHPRLAHRLGVSLPLLVAKRALLPPLARALGGRFAAELAYARGAWAARAEWRSAG